MDREELTRREAEAWAAFSAELVRVPGDRRERPGIGEGAWTVKDLLWHVAHWWDDLVGLLEAMRAGAYVEESWPDEVTDAENARVFEEGRRRSLAEVERATAAARERMLAAWAALPEVDDAARREFVSETIEHYEEHLPDLLRFAEEFA